MTEADRRFTPKNRIVLSLAGLYSVTLAAVAVLLNLTEEVRAADGQTYLANPVTAFRNNAVAELAWGMGFPQVCAGIGGMITVLLCAIYFTVCVFAVVCEVRSAVACGKDPLSGRQTAIYAFTVVMCLILSLGLSFVLPSSSGELVRVRYIFLAECLAMSLIIYAVFCLAVFFVYLLITALAKGGDTAGKCNCGTVSDVFGGEASAPPSMEKLFPALCEIDRAYANLGDEGYISDDDGIDLRCGALFSEGADVSPSYLCRGFRNFLASRRGLYYEEDVIRLFISALCCSEIILLEGLSGTGKSSLPRYFAEYVGGRSVFVAVQSTWRDRSDILGYVNDFTGTYNQTDFLAALYEANYDSERIYVFVLDELNISRVEYYFADFLSVLEYPEDEQKIRIIQPPLGFVPPEKLVGGCLAIPRNCIFVGTANKDGSTFAISDKVYDRAVTINFERRNAPFAAEDGQPLKLGCSALFRMFAEAEREYAAAFTDADRAKLSEVCDFLYENFGVAFGNRIANRLERLVPAFVACGGEVNSLVDLVLSQKLAVKLAGRFGSHFDASLRNLRKLIARLYGGGVLRRCEGEIDRLAREL